MSRISQRFARQCSLAVMCLAMGAVVSAAESDSAASRELHALFAEAWEADLREDPLRATYLGDRRFETSWPEVSPAAFEKRHAMDVAFLKRLELIDTRELSEQDKLNHELFAHEYRTRIALHRFKPYLYELRPGGGIHALSEVAELQPFTTVSDYEHWLARLRGLDRYVSQYIELLQLAIREKRTQPRVIMERIAPVLAQLASGKPEESPFYKPFASMPDSIPAAERTRLQAAARDVIAQSVIPAYRRFNELFRAQYLPACRDTVGIWGTPDGDAFYRELVRAYTTADLSVEEIHQLGLKEVARIRAEMDAIIREVKFEGTFAEFLTYLRTDPKFYYSDPDELFEAYATTAKLIDPELVRLFGKLPRTPYGVRPVPMTSAPTTTTAYYQPSAVDGSRAGYYYVNLYRPEVRPKYEIEVLTVHEAVPGHHLQMALAREQTGLPAFRRAAETTAFVEGWALYAERLGEDLGLYRDPYSRFGQLTYDMWRAVRLVVDTGLHARRWTRQQAIDYFAANAAKTEADIINEVDRYISWPGQALAYKIGQLRILELRALAQKELGSRFDIRKFHDVVLENGAVPLATLERIVREWIASEKSS